MIQSGFRLAAVAAIIFCGMFVGAPTDAAAAGRRAEASHDSCWVITETGFCGVSFGASENEARSAFHGRLTSSLATNSRAAETTECHYLYSATNRVGVALMFVGDEFERIDITTPSIATQKGAKVGMKLDQVEKLYPDAARQPNYFISKDIDLVVDLGDGVTAYFEAGDDGYIWKYSIGREKTSRFLQGCA
ncbi:MAG: hypothetical protein R3C60_02730 [Parvularculaceae bacterium]